MVYIIFHVVMRKYRTSFKAFKKRMAWIPFFHMTIFAGNISCEDRHSMQSIHTGFPPAHSCWRFSPTHKTGLCILQNAWLRLKKRPWKRTCFRSFNFPPPRPQFYYEYSIVLWQETLFKNWLHNICCKKTSTIEVKL